ncbi:MAG: geranylgeranylglyceryl phosphate synthase [Desulfurococcales archaeon ex4484_58]|nr:MAG: geranylgeranylglyceryl phosphate synthase [Desulfurococcales archaeon ex4484_58]
MGLRDYIVSFRVLNSSMTGLGIVFAIILYSGWKPDIMVLVIGFLTGFLGSSSAMLINDYMDRYVDSINKPWKPIPSGRVDPLKIRDLSILFLVLTIIINIPLGAIVVLVTTIYALISYIYSFLRKHWWSQLIVAFSTTSPIVYGYFAVNPEQKYMLLATLYSLTIFTASISREVLKAVIDIEGDKKQGYNTIPLKIGLEKTIKLLKISALTSTILAYMTGVICRVSIYYYILITITVTIYLYEIINSTRNIEDKEKLDRARKNILYAMLIGLIAYLTTYPP